MTAFREQRVAETAAKVVDDSSLRDLPAWAALEAHAQVIKNVHLRQLFAQDPQRGERLSAEAAGIHLDYSKHRISDETQQLLIRLAEESGLKGRIGAMFRGDTINVSEQRAVLHVALRAPRGAVILHAGRNVVPDVHAVLDRSEERRVGKEGRFRR